MSDNSPESEPSTAIDAAIRDMAQESEPKPSEELEEDDEMNAGDVLAQEADDHGGRKATEPMVATTTAMWFAKDPSKAYYEKLSLIWAPISMILLLGGLLGTDLYKYCNRDSYLIVSVVGCLPGVIVPFLAPCEVDRRRPLLQRFWVKGTLWIAIFGFYGNYFWTHYFYSLLGAEYLFDSYRFNDVPLVTFTCTFFYFTFYFNLVNLVLRRIAYWTSDFPPFGRSLVWWTAVSTLSYTTAIFEAVSVQHFPLYTYRERDAFLIVGSIVYGLYFIVGFPMFFSLDEQMEDAVDSDNFDKRVRHLSLSEVAINALGATAIVTLLLDLWRLSLGSIYDIGSSSSKLPFIYREVPSPISPSDAPVPSPQTIYIHDPVTVNACVDMAKGWAQRKAKSLSDLVLTRD